MWSDLPVIISQVVTEIAVFMLTLISIMLAYSVVTPFLQQKRPMTINYFQMPI